LVSRKRRRGTCRSSFTSFCLSFPTNAQPFLRGYAQEKRREKCFVCFHAGQKGQNWNFILSRKSRVRKSKTAKLFGKLPSTWVKVFSLPPLTLFDEFHFVCLLNCWAVWIKYEEQKADDNKGPTHFHMSLIVSFCLLFFLKLFFKSKRERRTSSHRIQKLKSK
jgi:hypothetical protein